MRVICVGGATSHCGKTSIALLLASALPGWAAVKVTPSRLEGGCPHGLDCGACMPPRDGYEIISETDALSVPGKDTARFIEAGFARVLWVRSLPWLLPTALQMALAGLSGVPGAVIESTTAIGMLGGLNILVAREDASDLKASARRILDRVGLVALNLAEDQIPWSGSGAESAAARLGLRASIVPVCAALPPDHPINREFARACRAAVFA